MNIAGIIKLFSSQTHELGILIMCRGVCFSLFKTLEEIDILHEGGGKGSYIKEMEDILKKERKKT